MIELKNSRVQYLGKVSGRDKYAVDAFIGAVQMKDHEGVWQDIKPRLVRDADGWHIEGAPYYAEFKDSGTRLFCPDKNERGNYLRLPAPALFSGLARNVVGNPARLDGTITPNQITLPAGWGEIRIIFSNTGMHFEILFTGAPPSAVFGKDSPRLLLDAETAGLDIGQLLGSKSGLGIPQPRLISDNQETRLSPWSYKNGQLELGLDFSGLSFPILLKNTTIDVQVGASADDGYVYSNGTFNNDNSWFWHGEYGGTLMSTWRRYDDITIPQGSTIDVAYESQYGWEGDATTATKIRADDQNAPDAPASQADYAERTLTTAGVDQDGYMGGGFNNTPSLVSVIQELVNSYGYSNQAIMLMQTDDGGTNYCRYYSWDYNDHSRASKLHIEYTAGGATARTAAETGAGVDALGESIAVVSADETGSGFEQGVLTSAVARISIETGSAADVSGLAVGLASGEVGTGADMSVVPGQKSLLAGDEAFGADALKAIVGTSGAGSDMKLPGRQGHVTIPSKGVSL